MDEAINAPRVCAHSPIDLFLVLTILFPRLAMESDLVDNSEPIIYPLEAVMPDTLSPLGVAAPLSVIDRALDAHILPFESQEMLPKYSNDKFEENWATYTTSLCTSLTNKVPDIMHSVEDAQQTSGDGFMQSNAQRLSSMDAYDIQSAQNDPIPRARGRALPFSFIFANKEVRSLTCDNVALA